MFKLKQLFLSLMLCCFALSVHAASTKALLLKPNDPVAGNPKGRVTIVEFFDYQCSYCVSMSPVIAAIIKANPEVRVVFKEYPIRGELSEYAARAALAANKQGKYYRFNNVLLDNADNLSQTTIINLAQQTGLNINKLQKDLQSQAITQQLQANYALARQLGINGTPAFFISKTNATSFDAIDYEYGAMSQSELQKAVNKALAN